MMRTARPGKRIGVFGGTFDPIHIGHLIIAEAARDQLGLSEVLLIPAATAPHKKGLKATDPAHRLAMVRGAVRQAPGIHASDLEVRLGGVSYTVDTLRFLRDIFPHDELWLLMGSDNLNQIDTWKEPEEILHLCRIAVYERPGFPLRKRVLKRTKAQVLEGGLLDLSATIVRRLHGRSRSIRFVVPPPVERYIKRHRLYRPVRRR